jgi:hypothetical protein
VEARSLLAFRLAIDNNYLVADYPRAQVNARANDLLNRPPADPTQWLPRQVVLDVSMLGQRISAQSRQRSLGILGGPARTRSFICSIGHRPSHCQPNAHGLMSSSHHVAPASW